MNRYVLALFTFGLIGLIYPALAQELTVTDSDGNLLMQVNDEGDAGSITLPPAPAVPADTANKLHNVGGVLYWQDAQLGTGWTRTGTDVHLIDAGDSVGIGVADPDAKLEVAGQVKITGGSPGAGRVLTSDADGLAIWESRPQPTAAYAGGNLMFQVTSNYGSYQDAKSVTITVPAAGTILTSASGYVKWESTGWDLVLLGILGDHEGDPNSSWSAENTWYGYLTIATDYNCSDASDQYASWSNQRGFRVGPGTHTFRVWTNKYSSSSVTRLDDINIFAEYYPD
jgi:hypothetical protein